MLAVISTLHLFPRLFFQKATITTTGTHVHTVKNARNWIEDVMVAGRKLVWLREGGDAIECKGEGCETLWVCESF